MLHTRKSLGWLLEFQRFCSQRAFCPRLLDQKDQFLVGCQAAVCAGGRSSCQPRKYRRAWHWIQYRCDRLLLAMKDFRNRVLGFWNKWTYLGWIWQLTNFPSLSKHLLRRPCDPIDRYLSSRRWRAELEKEVRLWSYCNTDRTRRFGCVLELRLISHKTRLSQSPIHFITGVAFMIAIGIPPVARDVDPPWALRNCGWSVDGNLTRHKS